MLEKLFDHSARPLLEVGLGVHSSSALSSLFCSWVPYSSGNDEYVLCGIQVLLHIYGYRFISSSAHQLALCIVYLRLADFCNSCPFSAVIDRAWFSCPCAFSAKRLLFVTS